MNNATEQAINRLVAEQFEMNADILQEAVTRGCEDKNSYHVIYVKMLFNSMRISAEISARIIVEILITLGMVDEKDEREIAKKMLSVVKGGIKEDIDG